jgi:hypothetical protein
LLKYDISINDGDGDDNDDDDDDVHDVHDDDKNDGDDVVIMRDDNNRCKNTNSCF